MADHEQVEVRTRAAWRAWLVANHTQPDSIWLVTFKRHHPDYLDYDSIVEEALCFGWVDSLPRKLDADRTMLRLSPRKPKSPWSRVNKRRITKMETAGQMTEAGRRKIDVAKADGSWTLLDAVEDLVVPDDLAAALDATEGARAQWEAFAPSSKKGILWWVVSAKRSPTRAKRVSETARLAAMGLRANFPESKGR